MSFGVRSQFDFPLTSKFNYSQSATDLGSGSSKLNTDVQTFQLGVDYLLKKFAGESELKPFVNLRLQNITNNSTAGSSTDTNRQNYTAGFYLRNTGFGKLSFRYDYISYGDTYDWTDTIISTRYDYAF